MVTLTQESPSGEVFPYHTLPRDGRYNVQFYSQQWELSFQINPGVFDRLCYSMTSELVSTNRRSGVDR